MTFDRPTLPAATMLRCVGTKSAAWWATQSDRRALALFKAMAARVPAYKDFLRKEHVNPAKIRTSADLVSVPSVTKNNYLRAYPWSKLCWDGGLDRSAAVFTCTSGSTGEPVYFPRNDLVD